MSATVNNAILGSVLRVGTIPSSNATPNFFPYPRGKLYSMDGGLISYSYDYYTQSNIFSWIGPNGDNVLFNNNPIFNKFLSDGFGTVYSGCWFDTEYNKWGAIPKPSPTENGIISYLSLTGAQPSYRSFPLPLFFGPLISTNYFKQSYAPDGGYAKTFIYAGIDQIIASFVEGNNQFKQLEFSIPYGISNMDFNGVPISGTSYPYLPAQPLYSTMSQGILYRPGPSKSLFLIPVEDTLGGRVHFLNSSGVINSGVWYKTIFEQSGFYLGRLWNGFVFNNLFTNYTGCCYTEDCITFYPLIDVMNNVDFGTGIFGLNAGSGASCFMSGFGFSYLANYDNGNNGLTQAAYKIYPAFNFSPLIPDKFFVPNICGCNNSAPILKNGVIQHA